MGIQSKKGGGRVQCDKYLDCFHTVCLAIPQAGIIMPEFLAKSHCYARHNQHNCNVYSFQSEVNPPRTVRFGGRI